jgi:hypothetical protein
MGRETRCLAPTPLVVSIVGPPVTPSERFLRSATDFASDVPKSLATATPQDLAQPFGGGDHGGGVQPARLPREPLNRAGDADGGDHLPRG